MSARRQSRLDHASRVFFRVLISVLLLVLLVYASSYNPARDISKPLRKRDVSSAPHDEVNYSHPTAALTLTELVPSRP